VARAGGTHLKRLRLAAAVVALAAVAGGVLSATLSAPHAGFTASVFVDIDKGTGTLGIAGLLEDAGVIRWRWQFLAARALRPRARLQAGEYQFSAPATVLEVFGRLVRGDVFYYELTVPEGNSVFEIAGRVAALGIIPAEDFLAAASDPAPIRDLAPAAPSLEGYLFPSTYRLTRHTTAAQLCRRMTERFREVWRELGAKAGVHERVTLASLVEKETAIARERPLVASVFRNRLRAGMSLDCDPTTIYAALLEGRYRGTIHQSDLANRNRYNTYQHAGLPPGPIANPGRASLEAALEPAETSYLYFVAEPGPSGAHRFSSTLAEHRNAVSRYRRGNPKAVQKTASRGAPARVRPGRRR